MMQIFLIKEHRLKMYCVHSFSGSSCLLNLMHHKRLEGPIFNLNTYVNILKCD